MITRKDLVEALRVLHETDLITKIVTRAKRIDVHYISSGRMGGLTKEAVHPRDCLLVLPNPTTNDTTRTTKTKNPTNLS